jgi:hypothetical protein
MAHRTSTRFAVTAAAAAITVAGCSSGVSAAAGQARAAAARPKVVAPTLTLASRMLAGGFGPLFGRDGSSRMPGSYGSCGNSGSDLQYGTYFELEPASLSTGHSSSYRQAVAAAVAGDGWTLRRQPPAPGAYAFSYQIAKPGLTGTVQAAVHANAVTVAISVRGRCFDAGAASASLRSTANEIALPGRGS